MIEAIIGMAAGGLFVALIVLAGLCLAEVLTKNRR